MLSMKIELTATSISIHNLLNRRGQDPVFLFIARKYFTVRKIKKKKKMRIGNLSELARLAGAHFLRILIARVGVDIVVSMFIVCRSIDKNYLKRIPFSF